MTDKKQKTGETKNGKSLTDAIKSADVLTNIASFLDYPLRSWSLARVSQTWNQICESKQAFLLKQEIEHEIKRQDKNWKAEFLRECLSIYVKQPPNFGKE